MELLQSAAYRPTYVFVLLVFVLLKVNEGGRSVSAAFDRHNYAAIGAAVPSTWMRKPDRTFGQ